MTITGRLTADATVNTVKDGRKVVDFAVAVNERYRPKGATERVKVATFFNCGYWLSEKMAAHLRKSTVVELTGRVYASAYVGNDGTAKASLNFHVSAIRIVAWPKEGAAASQPATSAGATAADDAQV